MYQIGDQIHERDATATVHATPEQPDLVWRLRQLLSSLAGRIDDQHPYTLHELMEGGEIRFELVNTTTKSESLASHQPLLGLDAVLRCCEL